MSQKGFSPIIFILVIVIIGGLIAGGVYYYKNIANKAKPVTQNYSPASQPLQSGVLTSEKEVLVRAVPSFDNLKLNDLPNFSDVRSVYKYGRTIIIVGYSRIVEFDLTNKKFVRVNKNESFGSIDSGVLIGDYLYVSGNRPNNDPNDFPSKRMIYKIDLRTGMLVKTLFADDFRRFANLVLIEKDGEIWGSSWDGVLRINPQNDTTIKIYNYKELDLKESTCPSNIFVKNKVLTVVSSCYDIGFTRFNEITDKWTYTKENDTREYSKMINLHFSDFGLELPYFLYVSNKVNDKYYIFADKGIYLLKRGEFPNFQFNIKVKGNYSGGEVGEDIKPKIYTTKDENFIILIGANICGYGGYNICSPLVAELVNLKEQKLIDLLENNDQYNNLNIEDKVKLMEKIQKSKLEESNGEIILKNMDNSLLVKIDLNSGKLIINP